MAVASPPPIRAVAALTRGAPRLERAVRRLVRREVRHSPALRAERRRAPRTAASSPLATAVFKGFLVLLLVIGFAVNVAPGRDGQMLLACILTLHATGTAFFRARDILTGIPGAPPWAPASPDLLLIAHLPVTDRDFFRLQWRRCVGASLGSLALFAGIFAYVLLILGPPPTSPRTTGAGLPAVLVLAIVQWFAILAGALAIAAFRPRWARLWIPLSLNTVALALFFLADASRPLAGLFGPLAILGSPAGWCPFALMEANRPSAAWPLWALPPAIMALAIPALVRRLERACSIGEIVFAHRPGPDALIDDAIDREMAVRSEFDEEMVRDPTLRPFMREELRRTVPALMQARVVGREGLAPVDWRSAGLLESAAARWMTPRERMVADFMLGESLGWTARWRRALAIAGIGLAAALAVPGDAGALLVLPPVIATLIAVPLFGGGWPGFQLAPSAGNFLPAHIAFPIGYRDIARVLFKVNAVRWIAWLPPGAVACMAVAWKLGAWPVSGAVVAVKIFVLGLAAQPFLMAVRLSAGSGDSANVTLRSLLIFAPATVLLIAFATGVIMAVAPFPFSMAVAGTLLAAMSSAALGAWYRWWYNRGRLDFVRTTAS